MDLKKTGKLLYTLRKEKMLTQAEIANRLNISPKTVSKWECGGGFPDVALLGKLSETLGVNAEKLLSGKLESNTEDNGNMKKTKFYVCENCHIKLCIFSDKVSIFHYAATFNYQIMTNDCSKWQTFRRFFLLQAYYHMSQDRYPAQAPLTRLLLRCKGPLPSLRLQT